MSRQGNCGGNSWARPNSKDSWNAMSLWLSGMKSSQAQDLFGSIAVLSLVLVWLGWPGWHPGSVGTGPGQPVPCRVGESAGTSSQILINSCLNESPGRWAFPCSPELSALCHFPTSHSPKSTELLILFSLSEETHMRRKRLRCPEGP